MERLLEQDTAGDPITGLKWTHKTTEKIAQQLQLAGIQVGRSTVARLLDDLDYALRVNQKKRAGASSPDRNEQFLFIQGMRQRFECRGNPVISVDTKKPELIGNFKNAGAKLASLGRGGQRLRLSIPRIWKRHPLRCI